MVAPNFDNWAASSDVRDTPAAAKAVEAWHHIQDNPTQIDVYREGVSIGTLQTVRIEFQIIVAEKQDAMVEASHRRIWIMGVKDHPSVTDTNLQNGDLFLLNGNTYEVNDVVLLPGELQADGVRMS